MKTWKLLHQIRKTWHDRHQLMSHDIKIRVRYLVSKRCNPFVTWEIMNKWRIILKSNGQILRHEWNTSGRVEIMWRRQEESRYPSDYAHRIHCDLFLITHIKTKSFVTDSNRFIFSLTDTVLFLRVCLFVRRCVRGFALQSLLVQFHGKCTRHSPLFRKWKTLWDEAMSSVLKNSLCVPSDNRNTL